jgi:hypothetical protein
VRRASAIVGIALALACAVTRGESFAAEPTPEERVESLLRKAHEAATSGRLDEALKPLYEAWGIAPSFKIACNIGRIESLLKGMRAAAEFLTICREQKPPIRTPEEQARDKRAEEDLTKALTHVASLQIEVSEPGAEVFVDDTALGRSPLPRAVFVEPGRHRVRATLEGREAAAVEVDGRAGASIPVRLSFQPSAWPVIARPPPPPPPASPPDKKPLVAPVQAPAPPSAPLPVLDVGLGAGSALTFGAGMLLWVLKDAAHEEIDAQRKATQTKVGSCPTLQCGADDALAKESALLNLSVVSFTAAASLTVTAIVSVALGLKRANKPTSAHARGVTVLEW